MKFKALIITVLAVAALWQSANSYTHGECNAKKESVSSHDVSVVLETPAKRLKPRFRCGKYIR
ncbi:MAG: hypothetical protein JXQ87_03800 [Bacteroidia bacterium]